MEEFKTVKNEATSEIIEKKSRFIANVYYIESEEEAIEKINKIKYQNYNARHNCYAYRIVTEGGIKDKSSDDGEPSGTAGIPILNALIKNELVNVLVVVTRYFGGILLGTGGLLRAYSESSVEAIKKAEYIVKELGYIIEIEVLYQDLENVKYILKKNKIKINSIVYEEDVKLIIETTLGIKKQIENNNSNIGKNIQNYIILSKKYIEK